MRHARIDTPAYLVWVEARPSFSGKGKEVYYEAVRKAARTEINTPITSSDIEVAITYSTAIKPAERMDADNVNKPTLDALTGVAYADDHQVRHVDERRGCRCPVCTGYFRDQAREEKSQPTPHRPGSAWG